MEISRLRLELWRHQMLQKIKRFIIQEDENEISDERIQMIKDALAHYCAICRKGFKTRAAASSHKSIRHKHE